MTRRRSARSASAAALLALALASSLALAGGKPPPEDRRARALFEEGIALSDEGKWPEALTAFQKSDEIVPSASVRFNIAVTQRALGRYVEAKRTLEGILAEPERFTAPIKPGLRKDIEAVLAEVKGKIVTLSLRVSPADAEVQVDGGPISPLPDGRVELDPGRHVFVVRAEGRETTTVTKTLSGGDTELALSAPSKKVVVVREARPAAEPRPAVYKQGWFWATVGAVVVAGAAVTVVAVVAQPDARAPAGPPTSTVDRVIPAVVRF